MLKHVAYHRDHTGFLYQVAYVILEDNCVFTTCQDGNHNYASSINYAETIVRHIAQVEQSPVESLRWFDMQTRHSYRHNYLHRPNPGDFGFDQVVFTASGTSWRATICPKHVSDIFKRCYIDGEPNQVLYHGKEKAQRIQFYNPAAEPVPPIDEYREPPESIAILAEAALKMGAKCLDCQGKLNMADIRFEDHHGGWEVAGMEERQWLWFECSKGRCRYQTSFAKLHFPGRKCDDHRPGDGEHVH